MAILAGGTNFLSAWMMQKSQPQTAANDQTAKATKWMNYLFPVMSFVFCLSNNAAFAIYWTFSSVLMIAINLVLNKKFPRPAAVQEDKK
jgi:membrane protein insertase Oxa1/YidC/SpoIIIJ